MRYYLVSLIDFRSYEMWIPTWVTIAVCIWAFLAFPKHVMLVLIAAVVGWLLIYVVCAVVVAVGIAGYLSVTYVAANSSAIASAAVGISTAVYLVYSAVFWVKTAWSKFSSLLPSPE